MWEELRDNDLFRDVPSIGIPVWFVVVENDYNTPAILVEEYLRFINAPDGKLRL
jgi:pimeloyl-ACP methyl ester carboxylesterase